MGRLVVDFELHNYKYPRGVYACIHKNCSSLEFTPAERKRISWLIKRTQPEVGLFFFLSRRDYCLRMGAPSQSLDLAALPRDMICAILAYTDILTVRTAASVCKSWSEGRRDASPSLRLSLSAVWRFVSGPSISVNRIPNHRFFCSHLQLVATNRCGNPSLNAPGHRRQK